MTAFRKIVVSELLVAGVSFLSMTVPTYALVIAAPLIAIPALKASVFLVSFLALPLTTLIHLLKKLGIIKTILISVAILSVIFGLVYGLLNIYKSIYLNKLSDVGYSQKSIDLGMPAYYDKIALPEASSNLRAPSPTVPKIGVTSIYPVLLTYLLSTALLVIMLLIPILIVLIITNKARDEHISLGRITVIGLLVSAVIAIPTAFCLGLLYLAATRDVAVY